MRGAALLAASSTGLSIADVSQFISIMLNAGLAGVGIIAFSVRWIIPKGTFEEAREEASEWKKLYDHEKEAHQATRDAFVLANQRGDAAIEAAKVTKALLEAMRPSRERDKDAVD